MDGNKAAWVGIAPSPKVLAALDQEETSVLALLAWCSATRNPVTSLDVAALPDRNGTPLGIMEARRITQTLRDMKIASVLGMTNDKPLSIFLGGFRTSGAAHRSDRPVSPARTPQPTGPGMFQSPAAPRPVRREAPPKAKTGLPIEHSTGKLDALKTTPRTPDFVARESRRLRNELNRISKMNRPVQQAQARKEILERRIQLYRRWLAVEPDHPSLKSWLERKVNALPELDRDIEQAKRRKKS
jgi:hypothetical protein